MPRSDSFLHYFPLSFYLSLNLLGPLFNALTAILSSVIVWHPQKCSTSVVSIRRAIMSLNQPRMPISRKDQLLMMSQSSTMFGEKFTLQVSFLKKVCILTYLLLVLINKSSNEITKFKGTSSDFRIVISYMHRI